MKVVTMRRNFVIINTIIIIVISMPLIATSIIAIDKCCVDY